MSNKSSSAALTEQRSQFGLACGLRSIQRRAFASGIGIGAVIEEKPGDRRLFFPTRENQGVVHPFQIRIGAMAEKGSERSLRDPSEWRR